MCVLKDHISSDSVLRKLGINIQTLLRYNRLRWFGHVVRNDGCKSCQQFFTRVKLEKNNIPLANALANALAIANCRGTSPWLHTDISMFSNYIQFFSQVEN